ncbi:seizure protein 6 homolog [Xenopus tropicalis]|uniref:Seizure protein 6 homolog n=1 Tax=Xenopus tropicalis TaxID=8364 RepID=A0A6I8REI9_XENTR|nr:seizure protein 6 homolog [Xenopus tropicalis]|eukprot:XP_004911761.1 PREDICTED: seizure protein 6 homolog [Xenopus tropicalis]
MYAVCFMLASMVHLHSQGQAATNGIANKATHSWGSKMEALSTTVAEDLEGEVPFITTAPTMTLLNHHPLLEGILHETIMKKDFQYLPPFFSRSKPTEDNSGSQDILVTQKLKIPFDNLAHPADVHKFYEASTTSPLPLIQSTIPMDTTSSVTETGREVSETHEVVRLAPIPATSPTSVADIVPKIDKSDDLQQQVTAASSSQTEASSLSEDDIALSTSIQDRGPHGSNLLQKKKAIDSIMPSTVTNYEEEEETTTSTIITTTVTMAAPAPEPCNKNFTGPEGFLLSPAQKSPLYKPGLDCVYIIQVYPGYGVEIKVQNISLSEGETITVESLEGVEPVILANESFMMRGQVIRSPTNQVMIHFQSLQQASPGNFRFHYQAYTLSCGFPRRPAYGDVSVTSLHPGGEAYFYCNTGYQLNGPQVLKCLNATRPFWSNRPPQCIAACGGLMRNITTGRLVSPNFPGNYSNNLTCHWVLEAPSAQRLHLHFEKVSLAEDDDRLIIRDGNTIDSTPIYDSYEVEYLPIEGLLSSTRHLFIEFTTDSSGSSIGVALRFQAYEQGHCYEPFMKYGNFTSSDPSFALGTVVEFTCDAGYTLEQGSTIIECQDPGDPQWNETEPACRAVCSGEITDSAGVVLSPNWPEAYGKGQDCIWGIHVEEDKRILLDIQILRIGKNDILTFYDGDDLTARVLGRYTGTHSHFKLYTSMADVIIQFQTDPGSNVFGYQQGFIIHFFEVPRNDTCPELPEIHNGWKTTSQSELVHGTVVTYQCYPGFEVAGAELLMCQWDLTWSGDLPTCERVTACTDPGDVLHSRRILSVSKFPVGSTVRYVCDKGYILTGSSTITCYNRQAGVPKWSDRSPKCVPEKYEPCINPGALENGHQEPEKRMYQPGEAIRFSCITGYMLMGEQSIKCVPGHPSVWSSPPPICKASYKEFYSDQSVEAVAKAATEDSPLEGTHILLAIFVPIIMVALVIASIYLYFSRLQSKAPLRLPLSSSPPYDQVTVESEFDNPTFETGDTREYEVSI